VVVVKEMHNLPVEQRSLHRERPSSLTWGGEVRGILELMDRSALPKDNYILNIQYINQKMHFINTTKYKS